MPEGKDEGPPWRKNEEMLKLLNRVMCTRRFTTLSLLTENIRFAFEETFAGVQAEMVGFWMEWRWQRREKSGSGYILKGKLTEPAGGWNVKQAIKGKFNVLVEVNGSCQLLS